MSTDITEQSAFNDGRLMVADELDRQAERIEQRIRMHGLGRHTVNPCLRCEAWRENAATLRRRAVELRAEAARPAIDPRVGESLREAAHREVMSNFVPLRREAVSLNLAGIQPTAVLLPARLNVPYDGPDATDDPGRLMNLPVRWGEGEHWGLVVEPPKELLRG